jgi:hypothetical protein
MPTQITAGDSLAVTLSLTDYPAPTWSVSLALAGPSIVSTTSVASGTSHALTLTTVQTAALDPGLYQYRLRATSSTEAITYESGTLTVAQDLATAAAGDLTSYAEQMLAVCRTARQNVLTGEMKTYMVGGRQVQLHTLDEIAREEARWQSRVNIERSGTFGTPARFDVVWR